MLTVPSDMLWLVYQTRHGREPGQAKRKTNEGRGMEDKGVKKEERKGEGKGKGKRKDEGRKRSLGTWIEIEEWGRTMGGKVTEEMGEKDCKIMCLWLRKRNGLERPKMNIHYIYNYAQYQKQYFRKDQKYLPERQIINTSWTVYFLGIPHRHIPWTVNCT